jgi:ribonuclease-3
MVFTFELKLPYSFRDPSFLELALTHASKGHEQKQRLPHNERLEFLGDAVLQLVISEHLYHLYPDIAEGRLTKIRSHLVNRSALVEMAQVLGLGPHLLLGKSEATQGGHARASNLANAFEAVIGAIFLDGGYAAAKTFVTQQIEFRLKTISDNPEPDNAKGVLQEKLHAAGKQAIYRITSETGPAHQKEFQASVEIDGLVTGTGAGATKKEAETRAAAVALETLEKIVGA